jgi:hypothetical protein
LEKVWALPEEVVRIAIQASTLGGAVAYLLVIMMSPATGMGPPECSFAMSMGPP